MNRPTNEVLLLIEELKAIEKFIPQGATFTAVDVYRLMEEQQHNKVMEEKAAYGLGQNSVPKD